MKTKVLRKEEREYAIPKINMLHNFGSLEMGLELLCHFKIILGMAALTSFLHFLNYMAFLFLEWRVRLKMMDERDLD